MKHWPLFGWGNCLWIQPVYTFFAKKNFLTHLSLPWFRHSKYFGYRYWPWPPQPFPTAGKPALTGPKNLLQLLAPLLLLANEPLWAQCDLTLSANVALGHPTQFQWTASGIQSQIPVSTVKQTANLFLRCNTDTTQWLESTLYLDFNPSSANYVDVLYRFDSTLQNGWILRLGDLEDGLKLIERKAGKERIECSGELGYFNKSKSNITLRWVKQNNLMLLLYKDSSWEQYRTLCAAIDTLTMNQNYVGLSIIQTGSGAAGKHRITTYTVTPPRPDKTAPTLQSLQWKTPEWAQLNFSEPIALENKNQLICNFQQADTFYFTNTRTLRAKFPPQPCNREHTVYVQNAKDSAKNIQPLQQRKAFVECTTPVAPYQITFTEIMADPNPTLGYLPPAQYIELKNNSNELLWLNELTLSDAQTTIQLPKYLLQPQQRITLCDVSDTALMRTVPNLLACKLPYINIESETLTLTNSQQQVVHQLHYQQWMHHPSHENGGYSLEHTDSTAPCLDLFQWYSNSHEGGTPSFSNQTPKPFPSVKSPSPNTQIPFQVAYIAATHTDTLCLQFTHPTSQTTPQVYSANGETAHTFTPIPNTAQQYHIQPPLNPGEWIHIVIKNAMSCNAQTLKDTLQKIAFTVSPPLPADIQFNEVLFNAFDHLPDYLEVVNTSNKALQLQGLQLKVLENQQIATLTTLQTQPFVLYPQQIRCYSNNPYRLALANSPTHYFQHQQVKDFPNLPADEATLQLFYPANNVVDEMHYNENMHTPILNSKKGVSLEKTQPNAPSNQPNHWVSATFTAGYATPGAPNSQTATARNNPRRKPFFLEKTIYLVQDDDYITLHHRLPKPGYAVTVSLFSMLGSAIPLNFPKLQVSDEGSLLLPLYQLKNQLPSGNYILHVDAFHPDADICRQNLRLVLIHQP